MRQILILISLWWCFVNWSSERIKHWVPLTNGDWDKFFIQKTFVWPWLDLHLWRSLCLSATHTSKIHSMASDKLTMLRVFVWVGGSTPDLTQSAVLQQNAIWRHGRQEVRRSRLSCKCTRFCYCNVCKALREYEYEMQNIFIFTIISASNIICTLYITTI